MTIRLDTVIFDLDGTLINSEPTVLNAINKVLAQRDLPTIAKHDLHEMIGYGARFTVAKALGASCADLSDAHIDAALDAYISFYLSDPGAHTKVYPGVFCLLDGYLNQDTKMGICTNKPTATTRPVLDALGLSRYFGSVLCGDDMAHPKPDGRHLLAVLEHMARPLEGAVYIGDGAPDVAAAVDAGMPVIVINHQTLSPDSWSAAADRIIHSFDELPDALASLGFDAADHRRAS